MGIPVSSQPGDMVRNCKIINYLPSKNGARMAVFECKCGTQFEAAVKDVRKFNVRGCKPCGLAGKLAAGNKFGPTHGMSHLPEYNIWLGVKKRCYNPKSWNYKYYGGKGVQMCSSWLESFENFYSDMGPRPGPEYSIEREKVDQDYGPENCTWLLTERQVYNRTCTRYVEYKGVKKALGEWAKENGLSFHLLRDRIVRLNWDINRAMTTPPDTRPRRNRQPDIRHTFGFIN